MKHLLFIASTCFGIFYNDYSIQMEDNPNSVTFIVKIVNDQPTICSLIISKLYIERPMSDQYGKIDITIDIDPSASHLQGFGSRTGNFIFNKGKEIPSLKEGRYAFYVDGLHRGSLIIDEESKAYFLQLK